MAGFTLVELLIVIIVIGILVTISYTGVNAVIINSKESEMQKDLTVARQKIEDYKTKEGVYPKYEELPADIVPASYDSSNFKYVSSYGWCGSGQCYCLEITNLVGVWPLTTQINYHISSINNDPLPGDCNGFQQEALGNGLGGTTVVGDSQYGHLEIEGKTPLKGSFSMDQTNKPSGYDENAMVRVAVYLNGTSTGQNQELTQYKNYVSGGGTASWYIGAMTYPSNGSMSIVVKVEWQDPVNGWSELISATLPTCTATSSTVCN